MFFRNLTLYRFPDGVIKDAESLTAAVAAHPLREPGPIEVETRGFVSPYGRGSEAMTAESGRFVLFAVGASERMLPPAVVADALAEKIELIAEREGRRPGGRERKRLKEGVISELLPRAFVRTTRTLAYLDLQDGWLVVDTASRAGAEAVVSELREALGRFPATPMAPEESPRALMTNWLANGRAADSFAFAEECELRDPAEAGAVVRCTRQDLETDEVREHLASGKQVFRLGLSFEEHVSVVLGEDLAMRKLRFLDVVLDQLDRDNIESSAAELDAIFALMTLELAALLISLDTHFGLPRPRERG